MEARVEVGMIHLTKCLIFTREQLFWHSQVTLCGGMVHCTQHTNTHYICKSLSLSLFLSLSLSLSLPHHVCNGGRGDNGSPNGTSV